MEFYEQLSIDRGAPVARIRAAYGQALAKLARRYDCPVHGARTVRLPNCRFRLERVRAGIHRLGFRVHFPRL